MSEVLAGVDLRTVSELSAAVPGGLLVVNADGTPVWANERTRSLFGLDAGSAPADWGELEVRNADGRPTVPPYERVFETGDPVRGVECRLVLGDQPRRVSLDAAPLTGKDGAVSGVALTVEAARDDAGAGTTDRSGATSGTRDDERAPVGAARDDGAGTGDTGAASPSATGPEVVERIDDAVFALDRDWRFTYVNERAAALLDGDREQLLGDRAWGWLPEVADTSFRSECERAMATQERVTFEAYCRPREEWFEVRAYPSETGLSVHVRDISEWKERERKLERYRTAVDAAGEGLYIVDDEGHFTEVNEAYASMVGMSREELVGAHVSSVVDDEDVLAAAQRIEEELVAGERETASLEAEFTTGDGDTWVGEAVFALIDADRGYERVGIVRDVTDRTERERELAARSRQGAAVADLGRQALETESLDEFLEAAAETVSDVLDTDYCKVLDLDAGADELHLRQGAGWDPGIVGETTVPASEDDSQAAYVLRREEPVVVEDMAAEGRFSEEDLLADHDVTSGVSTIIGSVEEPWGILGTHDTARRSFSDHDVDFVRSVAHLLAATIDNHDRRERLEEATEAFRAANRAVVREAPLEERTSELLDIGREFLGLEVGFRTRIQDGVQRFERVSGDTERIEEGGTCSLDRAYCKTVFDRGGLVAVHDAPAAGWTGDEAYETWEFDAYVGHVVTVDGEPHGTVGFLSEAPRREGFDPIERAFVEQLAQWMGYELTRRRNERDLETSRRRYRTLIDNFPNGVVALFDDDLRYTVVGGTTVSDERSVEEMAGEPVESVVPTDIAGRLLRNFRATIEGERRTFTVASNGEIRQVRTVPIRDADGAVRSGMAISQDITERLIRERRLRQQREGLDALNELNSLVQEVSESVVQQSDPGGVRATVQRQLEASDSYARAQLWEVGPDRESLVPADGTDAAVAAPLDIPAALADAHPAVRAARTGETQVVRRLGDAPTGPWADAAIEEGADVLAAVPVTAEHAMYGVLTVCTARDDAFGPAERAALDRLGTVIAHAIRSVHRESQLRRSEQLYRTLVEHIPDGAVTMTDADLRFRALAGELIDELDVVPWDLRGKRPTEVDGISPQRGRQFEAALETALDGGSVTYRMEYEDRVLDLQVIPVWDDGEREVVGTMTLLRDITDRVERRQQLEYERERLEFLVRLVRHNLLNSLNVVDGRLELMDGRVDYEVQADLETAKERTEKMIDLVETIRSMTNAAADSRDRQLEPVAVDDLLADQVESTAVTYPDATVDLAPVPEVAVLADDLLSEAVENILHNAVQHNDKPVPEVHVEATADEETVTISVADNGPGLPERIERHVSGTATRGFDDLGSGFGLYIAQEVVDSYGGTVDAEANDPEGTVFHITLPRADTRA